MKVSMSARGTPGRGGQVGKRRRGQWQAAGVAASQRPTFAYSNIGTPALDTPANPG